MSAVAQISAPISFSSGTTAVSADVNTNFTNFRSAFNNLVTGANAIAVDTIAENTGAAGVTIDGVVLKDSGITATGGGSLTGTWSDLGSVTTVDINGGTVGGVTLDGTISGTPTWASNQAITLSTAAQGNITSLGTLTILQVDNLNMNGLTLSSSGQLNITPAGGSAIVLDATISVDAGVVTGATSITSTNFVGDLTGDVTGNASGTAATVTTAAQTNITSLGTLTILNVDNLRLNGNTLSATSGAINITPAGGSAIVLDGTISVDAGVVTGATSITSTDFVGDIAGDVTGNVTGNVTGDVTGDVTGNVTGNVSGSSGSATGNAATATVLATTRAINGVNFNGSAAITVTAAAGTLTGTVLKATVVTSSLTTVGALNSGTITTGFGAIDIGSSTLGAGSCTFTGFCFVAGLTRLTLSNTVSGTGMMVTTNDGSQQEIMRDSSSRRWKVDVDENVEIDVNAVLAILPKEYSRPGADGMRVMGFIVEDFHDAGFPNVIAYDDVGPAGFLEFGRGITVLHHAVLRSHRDRLAALEAEVFA